MFSIYNNFNEGSCAKFDHNCRKKDLIEGINPKAAVVGVKSQSWQSDKCNLHVNSNWEKLRK